MCYVLKIHFLHLHLDLFAPNLGVMNDEYDKKFHQDVKVKEKDINGDAQKIYWQTITRRLFATIKIILIKDKTYEDKLKINRQFRFFFM